MAAGRGGGCCVPAALLLLLLLPPRALLLSLPSSTLDKGVTHRYDNVKTVEISVLPNVEEETVSRETGSNTFRPLNDMEISAEREEETLNNLVNLLQDVVKNIPTDLVPTTQSPTIKEKSSSSAAVVDTVWVNMKPRHGGSRTIALFDETTSGTTPFWKLRSDETARVVLHSEATSEDRTSLKGHHSETSESVVLFSEESTPEVSVATVATELFPENKEATTAMEDKKFDQMTNGALSSLVESLKNVKKLHLSLNKLNNRPVEDLPLLKPGGLNILESIDTLIETIKNAPSSIKDDPSLHNYIEESENYLKSALEVAGEAERKLLLKKEQEALAEMEHHFLTSVAPTDTHLKPSTPDNTEPVNLDIPPTLPPAAPESEKQVKVEESVSSTHAPHPEEETLLPNHPKAEEALPNHPKAEEALPNHPKAEEALPNHPKAEEALPNHSKAEEAEVDLGKLKAFINLLYGFSPQLTEYAEHSFQGNVAEDILEKSMEVIEAIKGVFCGNTNGQSKQVLKHLLREDMALVRKAMKES